MSSAILSGMAVGNDDGGGAVAVVGHAQREVAHASARSERCGFAMQNERTSPGLVTLHFDRAPVGPFPVWLQRFDGRFFRREADRQTLGVGRASSAVGSFLGGKDSVDISIAEAIERRRDLRHTHDVEPDAQPYVSCAEYRSMARHRCAFEQVGCQLDGRQIVAIKWKRARATPQARKREAVKWNRSGDYC